MKEPLQAPRHHLRFHDHAKNFATAFGSDSFGKRAEAFARFFGTPIFLIAQTVIVVISIAESDALHREELARVNLDQQKDAGDQLTILHSLLQQNNDLTALTHELSERISIMTIEMNERLKKSSL